MSTKHDTLPLVMPSDLAERLARAALRAWFGDQDGFKNMQADASRRAAVRAIQRVLDEASDGGGNQNDE